jgi:MFS transporter, FSR family, fosmidomycin resistance protein
VLPRCRRDAVKRRTKFSKQDTALRRQCHAPVSSSEQRRRTEPLFKQVNLPADRTVCHAKFGSGVFEAAAASRGFEGANRIQRWKKSTLHRCPRHDVSFPDLTPENNSVVDWVANAQVGLGQIFASSPPMEQRHKEESRLSHLAVFPPASSAVTALPGKSRAQRTLVLAGLAHALHDGFTDMIYVLLPVWQAQFALGYGALAVLRALYVGTLAALQVPSGHLARHLNARTVLVLGTLLCASGYILAGLSGGLVGLCASLALAGAGGSTQHPLASSAVSRAYGKAARGPLGTYNFAGDLGKATLPPAVAVLLTVMGWRTALWVVAGLGIAVALLIRWLMPLVANPPATAETPETPVREVSASSGFSLLLAIGVLDSAARMAFLLFLPFLLQAKGAPLTTVGFALSLVFIGGALGKAACGWLGVRLGLLATVITTEVGTAAAIFALLALPLAPSLALLPLLGVMLNGTSSVLYGTVPELVPAKQIERAFALFYTGTLGSSALAPVLYGRLGDAAGPVWATGAAAVTALAVVPLILLLSPRLTSSLDAQNS